MGGGGGCPKPVNVGFEPEPPKMLAVGFALPNGFVPAPNGVPPPPNNPAEVFAWEAADTDEAAGAGAGAPNTEGAVPLIGGYPAPPDELALAVGLAAAAGAPNTEGAFVLMGGYADEEEAAFAAAGCGLDDPNTDGACALIGG